MNKMFKKIFAVVAACATVATMSVSAFAAEEAAHDAGSVSVTGYAAVEGATQYTVMVFEDSFTGTEVEKIFYINQGSNPADLLAGMLVKGGELAVGDYTVRIGNDAGEAVDVDLKVEAADDGNVITIVWGDITGEGSINGSDAVAAYLKFAEKAVNYVAGETTIALGTTVELVDYKDAEGNAITAVVGDITGDDSVNGSDAVAAYLKFAEKAVSWTKTVNGTTYTIALGDSVNVKVVE